MTEQMAYRTASTPNWGVILALVSALPLIVFWTLVELVGGTLACEGVDGPCGATFLGYIGGVLLISGAAAAGGWTFNRVLRLLADRE